MQITPIKFNIRKNYNPNFKKAKASDYKKEPHVAIKNQRVYDYYGYDYNTINMERYFMNNKRVNEEEFTKIISSLAQYDYESVVENLLGENMFQTEFECLMIDKDESNNPVVKIGIMEHDMDSDTIVNTRYDKDDFIFLMQELKNENIRQYPQNRTKYEALTKELVSKVKSM